MTKTRKRIVIMGAAGRDFHNFNVVCRDDPAVEVVAFTATQIPGIAGRQYPALLAGPLYPDGIEIVDQAMLDALCRDRHIDEVVFAYSDVPHAEVMHIASRVLAAGADFRLMGPTATMLRSAVPVIAVSAVRTGCGKSQTTRWIARRLRERGLRAAVIRHPMPYGDLAAMAVQRFATMADLAAEHCTIEEREEYEPHIAAGSVVYAGVDYARIVAEAEREADVILWDGGNNDFPFLRPDLHLVLVDPLRAGHETTHHPGEAVLRMADVVIIAKTDASSASDIQRVTRAARATNPAARIVWGASPVKLDDPDAVRGKRVLVIEDGPTTTHGGMAHGAGFVAAVRGGAREIIDPHLIAASAIKAVYQQYPHIERVLPAMGYSAGQIDAMQETIERSHADVVVSATPIDLARLITVKTPIVRARYEFAEVERPGLGGVIDDFLARSLDLHQARSGGTRDSATHVHPQ
jgi:predicted GTPase